MRALSAAVAGFVIALVATTAPALAGRVAFVVGIDRYENLGEREQLRKAVNDANAVGGALAELGFTVHVHENLGRTSFMQAWSRFLNAVQPGDTTAIFFAGHGIELNGRNFIVPSDVPMVGVREQVVLEQASIVIADRLDELRARNPQVSLVILDACRDNPFVDSSGRNMFGTRGGLARMVPARGTFVMYSADAGQQALDRLPGEDDDPDANPNSVYTRTLLPLLRSPGLGLRDIAVRVRGDVSSLARDIGHDQFPAYYDALEGEVYLAGSDGEETASAPPGVGAPALATAEDFRAWQTVSDTSSVAVLKAFAARYPDSVYAGFALARVDELESASAPAIVDEPAPSSGEAGFAWDTIKDTDSVAVLQAYVARYPQTVYADFARARITDIESANAGSTAGQGPSGPPVSEERLAWESMDIGSVAMLKAYVARYPGSMYAVFARARIEELNAAAVARATPPVSVPSTPVPTVPSQPSLPTGDWFVILGSFPHSEVVKANGRVSWLRSAGMDATIINTNAYSNLTNGYYAVVLGPFSKSAASSTLASARRVVGDAYIKSGR